MKARIDELRPYFVSARVVLHEPVPAAEAPDESGRRRLIIGYFVNVGVSANAREEAVRMVEDDAREEGTVDWSASSWKSIDLVNPRIRERQFDVAAPKIWYKSGRVFFG